MTCSPRANKSLLVQCFGFRRRIRFSRVLVRLAGSDEFDDYCRARLARRPWCVSRCSSPTDQRADSVLMLETIRQFAEEQLAASGEKRTVRSAHGTYFAGREADIMAV